MSESSSISSASSISSETRIGNDFLPVPFEQQLLLSRRRTRSIAGSESSLTRQASRISSIVEQIRYDNEQTRVDEAIKRQTTAGLISKQLTVEDVLPQSSKNREKSLLEEGYTKEDLLDPPPDGGLKAWTCAVCVTMITFSTWGINNSYGVFLAYYLDANSFPGATNLDYAMIGTLVVGLSQILAPVMLILTKMIGFKPTLVIGMIIQTLAYVLASYATKIWHLYLTQGLLTAISFSILFCTSSMIISTWFLHNRAFANGIAMTGSAIGGVVFSLSINKVIATTGDQKWALRMLAIIGLVFCSIAIALMSPRNYKKEPCSWQYFKQQAKFIFDFKSWFEISTIMVCLYFGLCNIGYTVVTFSLSAYGTAVGLTSKQGSVLTALLNAAQIIGRPLTGFVADKVGRVNYSIALTLLNSILVFAFWINAKDYASLIAFSVVIGFSVAVASVMNQPLMADLIEPSRFPLAFSLVYISVGIFSFPSEVVALVLRTPENKAFPYLHSQIFAGCCYFSSVLFLFPLRELKIRAMLTNRRESTIEKLKNLQAGTPVQEAHIQDLQTRLDLYRLLLQTNVVGYFARMFYPIKA